MAFKGVQVTVASGGFTLLGQSGVAVSHTGDTNETLLATIAVPAGAMGANGIIVLRIKFTTPGTVGGFTPILRFGASGAGLTGTSMWAPAAAASSQIVDAVPSICNAGATNSQIGADPSQTPAVGQSSSKPTASIDTTAASEVCISASLANAADTITLAFYQALLYAHA